MIISISFDRTEGPTAMAKIEAVILDACEKEPTGRMELIEILGMAVESMPDIMSKLRIIRLPEGGAESCKDFKPDQGDTNA